MRHHMLPLSLALAMTAMTTNAAADTTSITLYSGNFDAVSQSYPSSHMPGLAQISQSLTREVPRGSGEISLDRLPMAIDVGSVQFVPATTGLRIASQRYDFALVGQDQLLQQAIGQRVVVEQAAGGDTRRFAGTLLSAGNGLTLVQDDGRVRVLASYSSFELESMPAGLSARPTLRWRIDSPRAGRENFQIDYATGGMAWQAEYQVRLDGPAQNGRMALSGAAQVVNRSGIDFPDTSLTLVAGSPNQARAATPRGAPVVASMMMKSVVADAYEAAPEVEESGEYHAYPLRQPVDLPNGSVQRVSLLDPVSGAGFVRRYEAGSPAGYYRPARPQVHPNQGEEILAVTTTLEFSNDRGNGLGVPLPAGRVRVFQAGSGSDALLGEAWLGHVPVGQKVLLGLGDAFDLTAKRKHTAFKLADDRLSLTETVEVTLSNAKSQPATVRLHEPLTRWQDWDVLESSQTWEKSDAQSIVFDVLVPPGKDTVVRYTVRYRWPNDVRP
ncbi:DUF4139 domain-containing protein [Xanthomonadaceae bacterium XH05]|nr:DUF4139 domain-containing protein [Xanthomonadaceae bacterium XH05]